MDSQNNPIPQTPTTEPALPQVGNGQLNPVVQQSPLPDTSQPTVTAAPTPTDAFSASPVADLSTNVSQASVTQEPTLVMSTPVEPVPTPTFPTQPQPVEPVPDLVSQPYVPPAPLDMNTSVEQPAAIAMSQEPSNESQASLAAIPDAPTSASPEPFTASQAIDPVLPPTESVTQRVDTQSGSMQPAVTSTESPEVAPAPTTNISSGGDNNKKRGLSGKTALLGFIIGLVVLSIPLSVILVQQQQNLMQEAKTKKTTPVRRNPQVLVTSPTPTVTLPVTAESVDAQLDSATKDVDEALSTVDQDLAEINQIDTQEDNESL